MSDFLIKRFGALVVRDCRPRLGKDFGGIGQYAYGKSDHMRISPIVAVVTCAISITWGVYFLIESLRLGTDLSATGIGILVSVSVTLGAVGLILVWGTRNSPRTRLVSVCVAIGVSAVVIITTAFFWWAANSGAGST